MHEPGLRTTDTHAVVVAVVLAVAVEVGAGGQCGLDGQVAQQGLEGLGVPRGQRSGALCVRDIYNVLL
jgi:hypothetical protein